MADHSGGGGYSGGADDNYGGEYSRGADYSCRNGYTGGDGYGCGYGSRPTAGDNEGDIEEAAAGNTNFDRPTASSDESRANSKSKFCCLVRTIIFFIPALLYFLRSAIVIPVAIVDIFIKGDTKPLLLMDYTDKPSSENNKSVKPKDPTPKIKKHNLTIVTLVRVGCIVSIWLTINLSVPNLKRMPLLGSQLWKWSLLATLALLGYPILFILYLWTHETCQKSHTVFKGSNLEYCMKGLAQSTILVQYFTIILILWMLCIDTSNEPLYRYGSMTLTSFLVGAILSIVKSAVLLWWKAKLIYRKYGERILLAGSQLYIHLLIVEDDEPSDMRQLVAWGESMNSKLEPSVANNPETPEAEDCDGRESVKKRKNLPGEKYMLKKKVSLEHIHVVATCLTNSFELTLSEDDDIPDISQTLLEKFRSPSPEFNVCIDCMCQWLESDPLGQTLFRDLLVVDGIKGSPTYKELEKWMVDGLTNCYSVGNRIDGAMDATRLLDRVLTGLIVLVVILIWIFITGFATTSVVVGLASIFLGLTFVFGDTCKTFFQGVIFSFVTHPFDVGDRCIIDDKEMKVKKINILTTTFFGSQSREVVIYPNSDLSNKHIVVLLHGERASESKPKLHGIARPQLTELEDVIELILPSSTEPHHIESLQTKIEGYLEAGIGSGNYKKPYWITFNEIGEGIKMGVHFYHNLNYGDEGDQPETLAIRKEKQRSKFFLQLRALQYASTETSNNQIKNFAVR